MYIIHTGNNKLMFVFTGLVYPQHHANNGPVPSTTVAPGEVEYEAEETTTLPTSTSTTGKPTTTTTTQKTQVARGRHAVTGNPYNHRFNGGYRYNQRFKPAFNPGYNTIYNNNQRHNNQRHNNQRNNNQRVFRKNPVSQNRNTIFPPRPLRTMAKRRGQMPRNIGAQCPTYRYTILEDKVEFHTLPGACKM